MSSYISITDQKILCIKSGNRCAIPTCHKELVIDRTENDRDSIIGVMAHIKGEKIGSARFDPNMTDEQRNCCDNLILLCSNCHKVFDDQYNTYTVEKLREIKSNHEKWVRESTEKEVINVTFSELNIVTKYLVSGQFTPGESYTLTLIPPKEKIKKNELSATTEKLIIMGQIQVRQVAHFIDNCPDIEFGERLKQGFVSEYEKFLNKGRLRGDDLFNALLDFASGRSNNFINKAAGLSVLVYLFEKCEVFEK